MVTADDIADSESWVLRQAERLSSLMKNDARNAHMPAYATSVPALAVVMAGSMNLPCYRTLAERIQKEHRESEHGGARTDSCEACGYFDGAVYKATNGRDIVDDFPELFRQQRQGN